MGFIDKFAVCDSSAMTWSYEKNVVKSRAYFWPKVCLTHGYIDHFWPCHTCLCVGCGFVCLFVCYLAPSDFSCLLHSALSLSLIFINIPFFNLSFIVVACLMAEWLWLSLFACSLSPGLLLPSCLWKSQRINGELARGKGVRWSSLVPDVLLLCRHQWLGSEFGLLLVPGIVIVGARSLSNKVPYVRECGLWLGATAGFGEELAGAALEDEVDWQLG